MKGFQPRLQSVRERESNKMQSKVLVAEGYQSFGSLYQEEKQKNCCREVSSQHFTLLLPVIHQFKMAHFVLKSMQK